MAELKTTGLLGVIAGTGIAGMLLMGLVSIYQTTDYNRLAYDVVSRGADETRALIAVETASVEFKRQVQEWKDTLLRGNDPAKFEKYYGNFTKREATVDENLKRAASLLVGMGLSDMASRVAPILKTHAELGERYREALQHYDKANPNAGKVVDQLVAGMDRPMTAEMTQFVADIESAAQAGEQRDMQAMQDKSERSRLYFLIVFVAASVAVLGCAAWGIRSILNRLGGEPLDAARAAHCIAQGQLDVELPEHSVGDSLMAAMREMKQKLVRLVGEIQITVHNLTEGSGRLESQAANMEDNSRRQSETAMSIASTAEEIAASIGQLSENSDVVRQISTESERATQQSVELINEIVAGVEAINREAEQAAAAMIELGERSSDISKIVQVIEEIAGQTNLLALNAAIEAARAGEQGRGFAVVADEVRNLSERTSRSTQEIVAMISKMHLGTDAASEQLNRVMERVRQSTARAGSVVEAVNQIQSGIRQTGEAIADITAAIHEQNIAASNIAANVENVSSMSASNYSAAVDLQELVRHIREISLLLERNVDFFKCDGRVAA